MKNNVLITMLMLPMLLLFSCATKTPSQYELDRRSNLSPSVNLEDEALNSVSGSTHLMSERVQVAQMPVRTEPLIEKIWIYPHRIGPNWLQGTWYFVEVAPAHWTSEFDVGHGK